MKIVCPHADRLYCVGAVLIPRQNDYFRVWCQRKNLLQRRQSLRRPIRIWRKPKVHRDDCRLMPPNLRQRTFTVARHEHFISIESPAQLLLQAWVVFDNKQFFLIRSHSIPLAFMRLSKPNHHECGVAKSCGKLCQSIADWQPQVCPQVREYIRGSRKPQFPCRPIWWTRMV